jgi:hypothetical protein
VGHRDKQGNTALMKMEGLSHRDTFIVESCAW